MAFYLKKTKLKGRTYLSIDESFYSHDKKGTAHKCYKSLGSVETWIKKGIPDPISHFQQEVDALNQEIGVERIKVISPDGPANYMRPFLNQLTDEEFEYFIQYQMAACERPDLIGAGAHTLDILRKE